MRRHHGANTFQILFLGVEANVSLFGLALQNGFTGGNSVMHHYGENANFDTNGGGGAVYVSANAILNANGNAFTHNSATALGGAIFEASGATVHVEGASFTGNVRSAHVSCSRPLFVRLTRLPSDRARHRAQQLQWTWS